MNPVGDVEVRNYIVDLMASDILIAGFDPDNLPDDFDLKTSGTLDSIAFIRMLAVVADRYGVDDDYESIEPEELTVLWPLSRYIARFARQSDTV